MSQENVEVVQRWTDAYNRRDFQALIDLTASDLDFQSRFVAMESEFRGHDRFPYAYFKTLDDAYERFQVIPSEFLAAGPGVLMVASAEWCGRTSGVEGQLPIFVAVWLRSRTIFRVETFTDRSEALEAMGLSEQDAHADS
jgi:ketosteroid isomerase-like protein